MNGHYILLLKERRAVSHAFKYKYYFLLLPIIAATILLLLINVGVEITFDYHEIRFSWSRLNNYKYIDVSEKGYFIKTEGCKIPGFDPFDVSIAKFVHTVKPIICYNETNPPLVESNVSSLWIVEKYFPNYGIYNKSNLTCCYRPFYRQDINESSSDNRYEYEKECILFSKIINIEDEFVKVECSYKGLEIYKDFHSFITLKNKQKKKNTSNFPLNVLILGIDAVSRLNFHRTMPQTLKYLQDIGATEFKGYNKVGDNTFPNLIPVLSGLSEDEFNAACLMLKNSTFDDCPLIWRNYSNAGYFTAFAEDAAQIALFNYMKNGFAGTPTDYYWRTFNYLAESEIGHEKHLNAKLCLGPRQTLDVLLSYVKKFTTVMFSHLYFGFFWETGLTHDYLNYPLLGDEKYYNLLKDLHNGGLLNRTVVVLLSDHGIRWGEIRTTHQGRIEERLPFLFFVLPKIFKERFPLASSNLRQNTKRLTTPYDLHETLVDLLNLKKIENDVIRKKVSEKNYAKSRGISLFLPINDNRTCQSAAIDPHWCTCHETRKIDVDDEKVLHVGLVIVDHINRLLANYVQCAKLNITKIVDATLGAPSDSLKLDGVAHIVQDYTLVLQTEPGSGLFEATVRHSATGWNVTGTVSRINLYGKQSYCVDNFHLKLYCFCDHSLSSFNI